MTVCPVRMCRGSDTLTYDYENRLISYGTTTFDDDGDGGRVKDNEFAQRG
jgi:hypothetical protein